MQPIGCGHRQAWEAGTGDSVRNRFRPLPSDTRLLIPRKEVIQPHLPIRLPCYDFTPVMKLTVAGAPLAVTLPASGKPHSHGVTGGVYKTRERIRAPTRVRLPLGLPGAIAPGAKFVVRCNRPIRCWSKSSANDLFGSRTAGRPELISLD